MEITRSDGAGTVRVGLRGRLDAAWSGHVQEALSECVRSGQHVIELDLSLVDFLSSAGIRVLLVTYRQLRAIEGRLAVVAASDEVRQVIELAGLRALLVAAPPPVEAPEDTAPREVERAGMSCTVHALDPQARVAVRAVGDPAAWLRDGSLADESIEEMFPPTRVAVGMGAFGSSAADCRARFGELLAVGGAAVTLPTGGEGRPDWLLCEERLVPKAHVAYGLVGDGGFSHLARFDAGPAAAPVGLDGLMTLALAIVDAEAVAIALVAEAGELVGAALRRPPSAGGMFAFPAVRDQLEFTAEPAHAGTVAVVAGFVSRTAPSELAPHLRRYDRDGTLAAHLHAAVFPYRPVQHGRIALDATVRELFESQNVLALLHLLYDWRPGGGAGQSRFFRGALWCAPLTTRGGGGAA